MRCLSSLLLGGWVVGALALAPGCRSDPDLTPSPLPPAYAELVKSGNLKQARGARGPRGRRKDEQVLDGVIASVGDQFLTRREVERRLRLRADDPNSEGDREAEIDEARVKWAEQQLLVKASRQTGIMIQASRLEEYAEDRLESMIKRASDDLGQPISRDQYLAERRLTYEEFVGQMRAELMEGLYLSKLRDGISGTRPIIDRAVSPAEVRRVYRENREAFNIKAGAKLALFQFLTSGVADDDHTPAEHEALVKRRAEQLASLFRVGHKPKRLVRHYKLNDEETGVAVIRPGFEPRDKLATLVPNNVEFKAWMLDPARQPLDTFFVNDAGGPLVIGILDLEHARVLPYAEARERIVGRIRDGMALHLRSKLLTDMIAQGAVVSPPELEDMLLDRQQDALDLIAADPILKSARLQ